MPGILQADPSLGAALGLVREGRLEAAEEALAALPTSHRAAASLLAGSIAARRGDLARALSETGRAVQLALDDGAALAALASVQLALGRPAFARLPAQRAAKRAGDDAAGHAVLAAVAQRRGSAEGALMALRHAAVAAAVASGHAADTPDFRAIAASLAERLLQGEAAERARRFQAAARGPRLKE